jgi:hypothetical protein
MRDRNVETAELVGNPRVQKVILVRRVKDGSYQAIQGHRRLRVELEMRGRAEVMDIESRDVLTVHEVGDRLLVLTEDARRSVEEIAETAIERARTPRS